MDLMSDCDYDDVRLWHMDLVSGSDCGHMDLVSGCGHVNLMSDCGHMT